MKPHYILIGVELWDETQILARREVEVEIDNPKTFKLSNLMDASQRGVANAIDDISEDIKYHIAKK